MSRRGSVLLGVGGLTLAARVVGFGRSLVFSKTVGDTCLGDVYNAANALPNVLFEVAAGGVLAGVVVPVVARHLGAGRRSEADRTTSALLSWTLLVLTVVAVAALLGAGLYARAYAKADCAGSVGVLGALVVMFVPQVWFYGVAVVSAGVLQAHGRFLAAAAAPLLSSVVVVVGVPALRRPRRPGREPRPRSAEPSGAARARPGDHRGRRRAGALHRGPAGPARARGCARACGSRRATRGWSPPSVRPGLVGLVLQQVSVLVVNLAAQRSPDPGALTRFTWANALYLLPYAVLAAPVLQLDVPPAGRGRRARAPRRSPASCGGPPRRWSSCPGSAPRCSWPPPCPSPGSSCSARAPAGPTPSPVPSPRWPRPCSPSP